MGRTTDCYQSTCLTSTERTWGGVGVVTPDITWTLSENTGVGEIGRGDEGVEGEGKVIVLRSGSVVRGSKNKNEGGEGFSWGRVKKGTKKITLTKILIMICYGKGEILDSNRRVS